MEKYYASPQRGFVHINSLKFVKCSGTIATGTVEKPGRDIVIIFIAGLGYCAVNTAWGTY